MAFSTPNFNIVAEYRHLISNSPATWGSWISTPAQLKGMPKTFAAPVVAGTGSASLFLLLKLPARTDIRDSNSQSSNDQVKLPDWTGDPLAVCWVYDVAFGFPNEYRVAVLARTNLNGSVRARPPGQGLVPGT